MYDVFKPYVYLISRRILYKICRYVQVDQIIRCVSTAYMIAFSWKRCAQLIERAENLRRQEYEWVILSRYDLHWMIKHPPLAFFDKDHIWSMHPSSWGFPDQHLVFSRHHLRYVGTFWDSLSCPIPRYLRRLRSFYSFDENGMSRHRYS